MRKMPLSKNCCYECEKRTVGCHCTCEEYDAYSTALREKRQIEYDKRMEERAYEQYVIAAKTRNKTRRYKNEMQNNSYE